MNLQDPEDLALIDACVENCSRLVANVDDPGMLLAATVAAADIAGTDTEKGEPLSREFVVALLLMAAGVMFLKDTDPIKYKQLQALCDKYAREGIEAALDLENQTRLLRDDRLETRIE